MCPDDIKAIVKILRDVIQKNYSNLSDATKSCLKEVAKMMYTKGLISRTVQTSPTFDSVISEFETTIQLSEDIQQLEEKCHQFVLSLSSQGGPAQEAVKKLSKQWKESINSQFKMSFMNQEVKEEKSEVFTEHSHGQLSAIEVTSTCVATKQSML